MSINGNPYTSADEDAQAARRQLQRYGQLATMEEWLREATLKILCSALGPGGPSSRHWQGMVTDAANAARRVLAEAEIHAAELTDPANDDGI